MKRTESYPGLFIDSGLECREPEFRRRSSCRVWPSHSAGFPGIGAGYYYIFSPTGDQPGPSARAESSVNGLYSPSAALGGAVLAVIQNGRYPRWPAKGPGWNCQKERICRIRKSCFGSTSPIFCWELAPPAAWLWPFSECAGNSGGVTGNARLFDRAGSTGRSYLMESPSA